MKMGKIEKSLILDSYIRRRKSTQNTEISEKQKKREIFRRISIVLRKCETLRTTEEIRLLESKSEIVKQVLQRKTRIQQNKERILEREDPYETIDKKARQLADVLSRARHLICYTGAGISTSARIPDYRGSQGIWTLLQKGQNIGQHDLSLAEPTFTHMALYELHRRNILQYVLSQNCDGLHLRSGLPKSSLSEIHGNMYIEVCKYCKPNVEYWRLFDTTELTARYYHKTNRRCHFCGKPLQDTIVHFGERGNLAWPLNWDGACKHADKADVILCLGSSLKVLKKYSWLWSMDRAKNKRPKIYIVNLQWTPKDSVAKLKINGKCDDVMRLVMNYMSITVPEYCRQNDPIFAHANLLANEEFHTVSQPMLKTHKEETVCKIDVDDDDDDEEDYDDAEDEDNDDEINSKLSENEKMLLLAKVKKKEADSVTTSNEIIPDQLKDLKIEVNTPLECTTEIDNVKMLPTKDCITSMDNHSDQSLTLPLPPKVFIADNNSQSTNLNDNEQKNHTNLSSLPSDLQPKVTTTSFCKPSENNVHASSIICDNKPLNANSNDVKVSSSILPLSLTSSQLIDKNQNRNEKDLLPINELNVKQSNNSIKENSTEIIKRNGNNGTVDRIIHNGQLLGESDYYNSILLMDFSKSITTKSSKIPHWYDTNYAYSGLHSIIHPPPNEVDIWGTIIIPIFQLNRQDAECEFCFNNYAELKCQFYRYRLPEFHIKKRQRAGRWILCECCDYTDDEADARQLREENSKKIETTSTSTTSTDDDVDLNLKSDEKRAKLSVVVECQQKTALLEKDETMTGNNKIIQPGWYGKGYRKLVRRRRKPKLPPLVTV